MPYARIKDLGFKGLAFPFRIDSSGRVAVAETDAYTGRYDSIYQALDQLMRTAKGERFFNRSFGAKPVSLVFRRNVPEEMYAWFSDVHDILATWEPRVEVFGFEIVDQFESTTIMRIGFRVNRTLLEGFVDAEIPLE